MRVTDGLPNLEVRKVSIEDHDCTRESHQTACYDEHISQVRDQLAILRHRLYPAEHQPRTRLSRIGPVVSSRV